MDVIGGVATQVQLSGGDVGNGFSIALSEPAGSAAAWTLDVEVDIPEGRYRLGRVVTRPPSLGDPPARIVAIALCPGAIGWRVIVLGPVGGTCDVTLASSRCGCATPGVTRIQFP